MYLYVNITLLCNEKHLIISGKHLNICIEDYKICYMNIGIIHNSKDDSICTIVNNFYGDAIVFKQITNYDDYIIRLFILGNIFGETSAQKIAKLIDINNILHRSTDSTDSTDMTHDMTRHMT